jgi:hypothetical protein
MGLFILDLLVKIGLQTDRELLQQGAVFDASKANCHNIFPLLIRLLVPNI